MQKAERNLSTLGGRISLTQLDSFLGVTRGKSRNWSKGQRPSADDLETIAYKLGFNPIWLLTGIGDPEAPWQLDHTTDLVIDRKDGQLAVGEITKNCPITAAVYEIESAMKKADDLAKLKAIIADLEGQHHALCRQRGAYGNALREPSLMAHEERISYPGDACGIDQDPSTTEEQVVVSGERHKVRARNTKSND
nr:hypothetical protein [uncultured Pseudodesulfovibrio sp.]